MKNNFVLLVSYFRLEANLNDSFFFFNDTATTEIYTLSLHDALPICGVLIRGARNFGRRRMLYWFLGIADRKSTRLNSSNHSISYAVFCLKKKINLSQQLGMKGGRGRTTSPNGASNPE